VDQSRQSQSRRLRRRRFCVVDAMKKKTCVVDTQKVSSSSSSSSSFDLTFFILSNFLSHSLGVLFFFLFEIYLYYIILGPHPQKREKTLFFFVCVFFDRRRGHDD